MSLILLEPPAAEPLSLAEGKAHLRVDHTAEDALIAALITAVRTLAEAQTGAAFVTRTVRAVWDDWPLFPGGLVALPVWPVTSVLALRVRRGGAMAEQPLTGLELQGAGPAARFRLPQGLPAPEGAVGGIALDLVAGFGPPAAVPGDVRQALLVGLAHAYENREDGAGVLAAMTALLGPYRRVRL